MSRVDKSITEIQGMVITPEEIFYVVEVLARQHRERDDVDFYTMIGVLAERYQQDSRRSFCVMQRMRCTVELVQDKRMKGWTIQGIEDGCLLTNEAIFRAAAKCPMRATAKRIWFDPDEFFSIALSETEAVGRA